MPLYPSQLNGGTVAGNLTVTGNVYSATVDADTQPNDVGFVAWSYDPSLTSNTTNSVLNQIYLTAVYVKQSTNVTKLHVIVNAAGSGATAGANNLGLYDSSGTLLASVNVDAAVTSTGPHFGTISSTPVTPGMYWVAQQWAATAQPGIGRTNALILSALTINQTAATYRFATNGTGTTLPATITPGSNSTTNSAALWAGIS